MKVTYLTRAQADSFASWLYSRYDFPVGWERRRPNEPTAGRQRRKMEVRLMGVQVELQYRAEPDVFQKAA
jgi:hypothetical protein